MRRVRRGPWREFRPGRVVLWVHCSGSATAMSAPTDLVGIFIPKQTRETAVRPQYQQKTKSVEEENNQVKEMGFIMRAQIKAESISRCHEDGEGSRKPVAPDLSSQNQGPGRPRLTKAHEESVGRDRTVDAASMPPLRGMSHVSHVWNRASSVFEGSRAMSRECF